MKFLADVNIAQSKYQVPTIIFRLTDQKPENIRIYLEKMLEGTTAKILSTSLTVIEDNHTNFIPLTSGES